MDGYEICIKVSQAGITVSSEPLDDEQGEPAGTPAESIDAALDQARAIYKNSGQMPESTDAQDDASFEQGFGGGNGPEQKFP